MDDALRNRLQAIIDGHPVVLFMKGTKHFPQCGFSHTAAEILRRCGAEFVDVNVLEDPAIRQGIKELGNWPTIPQLWVKGKLLGGSDIVTEMYENGELQPLLDEAKSAAPIS